MLVLLHMKATRLGEKGEKRDGGKGETGVGGEGRDNLKENKHLCAAFLCLKRGLAGLGLSMHTMQVLTHTPLAFASFIGSLAQPLGQPSHYVN